MLRETSQTQKIATMCSHSFKNQKVKLIETWSKYWLLDVRKNKRIGEHRKIKRDL